MDLQKIVFGLGLASLLCLSGYWLAHWGGWPQAFLLKWAGFLFFLAGGIVWLIQRNRPS